MAVYEQPSDAGYVEPRLAVSVLMLRRDAPEIEVFIQHRVSTMDFAAGAVVFPGGRVDPIDYESAASHVLTPAEWDRHALAWERSAVAVEGPTSVRDMSRVLVAAALREVQEETGAVLEAGELVPWANWVTPPGGPKRFDTYFYLAVVGPSSEPRHQTTEASASHWLPVREVLQGAADGTLQLMRPTFVLLKELAELDDLQTIVAHKRSIIPNNSAVQT